MKRTKSSAADRYTKSTTLNKHGDLSILLAKRFSVDISGNGVDMLRFEQSLGQVDLARLEAMKDQGAQAK